ncbi:MAG: DNA-protecting protein DprA [Clostridiales bacterium]|nr:DNA-protecting protein DprA [Clostridiales bacterium]
MAYTDEQLARIWLQCAPMGVWNKLQGLRQAFDGPLGVWQHFTPDFYDLLGENAFGLLADLRRSRCREVLSALDSLSARPLFFGDGHYPLSLSAIDHPPDVLFMRGELPPPHAPAIAIVGSRRSTRYGAAQARRIARELAERGVTIVSGLARGIDSAAHLGALDAGGKTVGVLGCGLSIHYPPENKELAQRIVDSGGAILSELSPSAPPLSHHFPVRNRIISGLSDGVLLIEAQEKSGTHSTINYALHQGREVFALPGNVDAPGSELPLKLLKEGAALCTCGEDILSFMGWQAPRSAQETFLPEDESLQDPVLQALAMEEKTLEELLQETGMPVDQLTPHLTLLELSGQVERRPGRAFARVNN